MFAGHYFPLTFGSYSLDVNHTHNDIFDISLDDLAAVVFHVMYVCVGVCVSHVVLQLL